MIYPMIKNKAKNSKCFMSKQSYLTKESVSPYDFYLTDLFVDGKKRYRLNSKEPMRMADTLEFEINCPYCGRILHLCDMAISSTELGLYKCNFCQKD